MRIAFSRNGATNYKNFSDSVLALRRRAVAGETLNMIDRYTLPEMGALWSEQNKFQKWLDVEIAVCEVHAEMGTIPRDALEQIKARAKFSVQRIN